MKTMMISSRQYDSVGKSIDKLLDIYRLVETDEMKIGNAYGFCGLSTRMYGGRVDTSIIPWEVVEEFNQQGITFSATLTNHYVDNDAIKTSFALIEKLMSISDKNSIIALNRTFAREARKAFPSIIMKQSCIADPTTLPAIEKALEVYDLVTLSQDMLDEVEFISSLPKDIKDRLVLFGNKGCSYHCEDKTCYVAASQRHFGKKVTSTCAGRRTDTPEKRAQWKIPVTFVNKDIDVYQDIQYIKFIESRFDVLPLYNLKGTK